MVRPGTKETNTMTTQFPLLREAKDPESAKLRACYILGSLKKDHKKSASFELASYLTPTFEKEGVQVDHIVLSTKVLNPGNDFKINGDDFPDILDTMKKSDIIVFVTPIWWGSGSSLIQRVVERLDSVDEVHIAGKTAPFLGKAFGVVVSGMEDGAQQIIGRLNGWATFLAMQCPPFNSVYYLGEPKEVKGNKQFKTMAEVTAQNLITAARVNKDVDWADSRGGMAMRQL